MFFGALTSVGALFYLHNKEQEKKKMKKVMSAIGSVFAVLAAFLLVFFYGVFEETAMRILGMIVGYICNLF